MYQQGKENVQQGASRWKEKRKPVRRDLEKRRQQNIQAQRKYREKLRARLDRLEALATSVMENRGIETTPATNSRPSDVTVNDACSSSRPSPGTAAMILPTYVATDLSASDSSSMMTPGVCQCLLPQMEEGETALSKRDSAKQILPPDNPSAALSMWDPTTYVDPSLLIYDTSNVTPGLYYTTTINCGCTVPHLQLQTKGTDPFNYEEVRLLRFGPDAATPDPYSNNIRIETMCTISALYTVGMHIGINEDIICSDNSLSPFFRSSSGSGLDDDMVKSNMVCAVQRTFQTLKPDLRPSSVQITVQHHPYIDILPSPTLRNNLITRPGEFDEDEFFYDMLTGLVCWGNGGIGKRDRQVSTGYASSGTPWDVRSWEAKMWFLKKYWALLGGEDGELVRQSEWWRSLRGEDAQEIEVYN
ncbi:hypothetical protein AJ78_02918 [Emergomyces pasteurianus Ep9510]|uniref:BZIP domain-containing protein n=1 Tax=Emergomyces pasteurianus Ep9510 TaxID=1447872 RepID=A0A1J9PKB2_9EURO|nr:hypothetical protein AJ78_02918 [Emergomyces pasteurianus Ep9510]